MANFNQEPTKVVTGEGRFSYAYLFTPYVSQTHTDQEPKYKITLLIPKSDVQTKARIDAAIAAAREEGLNGAWNKIAPPTLPLPLYDGDGIRADGTEYGPECKGHWLLTAKTKLKPQIVDGQLQPIMDESEVYSGCYGRISVKIFPYGGGKTTFKKGISALLNNVQKTRDGEPLGGRTNAEDDFAAFAQPAPAAAPQYQQPQQYQQMPTAAPQYQQPQQPQQPQQYQQPQQIDPITGEPYPAMDPYAGYVPF